MSKKVNKKVTKKVVKPAVEVEIEVKEVKTEDKTEDKTSNEKPKVIKEKPVKEKKIEPTIFDRYRNHINTVKEGYLKKLTYEEAMDMLRYIQKHTGHQLGLNMSCGNCLIELVQIFMRLEKK